MRVARDRANRAKKWNPMSSVKNVLSARPCLFLACVLALPPFGQAQNTAEKVLVGNTRITVIASYKGEEKLPTPSAIVVHDFDVPSEIITIDRSASAYIASNDPIARARGNGNDQDPAAVAQKVQAVFSKTLLSDLKKSTIPVTQSPLGANSDTAIGTLIVRGNFTTIKEGNKTKRMMIGLGRGASDVQAHVTISLLTAEGPVLMSEFNVDSDSGKKPGAAETMGAGRAGAAVAANGAEDRKETVEGDTARIANAVAKELRNLMTSQQWIPPQSTDKPDTPGAQQ